MCAAFHEMDSLMHSRLYTESCIQKLEKAIIKFQETFKSVADSLNLSCKFPKFHILPRFASVIRSIGAPIITSTSYQEATHKSLKVHHRHTNNSREHFQKQINDFSIIHDIIESFQKDSVMTSTRVSKVCILFSHAILWELVWLLLVPAANGMHCHEKIPTSNQCGLQLYLQWIRGSKLRSIFKFGRTVPWHDPTQSSIERDYQAKLLKHPWKWQAGTVLHWNKYQGKIE